MTITMQNLGVCIRTLCQSERCSDDLISRVVEDSGVIYRKLIEHIPAITYVAAMDGTSSTLYTSPQIETLLGFSQTEWMADPIMWLKQIHSDDRTYVVDELARMRAGGSPVPCEYRMLTRDGCEVGFRDDAAIERDSTGCPILLYGVMLDITERKRLEHELSVARCRLAESVKVKLNEREETILHLVSAGRTQREVARELALSERAVRYCLKALYQKLGVANKVEAVRMAIQMQRRD